MKKRKDPILGWHTLEDYARWADIKIGDMVRLDIGTKAGFPIGYVSKIAPKSITLTRNQPNCKFWNDEDRPIEYKVKEMTVFYGMSKLEQEVK